MFYKLLAFFAVLAVAFAAPKPEPAPQYLTYSGGLDYVYPGSVSVPGVVPYAAPYTAPYAPLAYSAYPNTYFVRK